ncbi:Zinc finger protein [Aphelenchoides besseyi]|nr:Zinc finger protein [Aphelenchoides besseyi]KAI6210851.1 Zinc finger protein [Aphelenchoides besseyi]
MKIENHDLLVNWIKKEVAKSCDAEPVAFAKYVTALLKKDEHEEKLRSICCDQLSVFLADGTDEFVSNLFKTLESQAYLTEIVQSSLTEGDTDASTIRGVYDRHLFNSRDRDRRSRSRSPHSTRRRSYNSRRSRSRSLSPSYRRNRDYCRRERSDRITTTNVAQRRTRCPDFEEKGFCRRVDKCQYEHGPDAIVLDDNNIELRSDYNGTSPLACIETTYPTTPSPCINHVSSSPNVQQAEYNPEAPALNGTPSVASGFAPNFNIPPAVVPSLIGMNPYLPPPHIMRRGPIYRFFGAGRGRYTPYSNERVPPMTSTSIEVRRIPYELNKLGTINEHFSQFGVITNIQISFDGTPDTALVTFAKLPDAQAAMKSEKAILGNRFIRLNWHKPPPTVDKKRTPQVVKETPKEDVEPVITLSTVADPSVDMQPVPQLPQSDSARRVAQVAEENIKQRSEERQRFDELRNEFTAKGQLYEEELTELKSLANRMVEITDEDEKIECTKTFDDLEAKLKNTGAEVYEMHTKLKEMAAQLQLK